MLYTLTLDENNYILSIANTSEDNFELNLDELELKYLNAYKVKGAELILDEIKKAQLIAEEKKEAISEEIQELKQKLYETDYITSRCFEEIMALDNPITFISDFIKILVSYSKKYKEVIANRKIWRERIEELEK